MNKKMISVIPILIFVLISVFGCAELNDSLKESVHDNTNDDSIASSMPENAVLRGVLIDSKDNPIKDAVISLHKTTMVEASGSKLGFKLASVGSYKTVLTNEDGSFIFTNIASGRYYIEANANGLKAQRADIVLLAEDDINLGALVLKNTGEISGIVKLSDKVDSEYQGSLVYIPGTSFMAFTASDGKYVLSNVPQGTYSLYFKHDRYTETGRTDIVVLAQQVTTVTDVTLLRSEVASSWLSGEGAPHNELGEEGFMYIDTLSGNLYLKAGGGAGTLL